MLPVDKKIAELKGLTVTQFMDEIKARVEEIELTPEIWGMANLANDVDPVAWFAECLSKSPNNKRVWMCYRGDVTPDGGFTHDQPLMAVTGNGDNSESRARYLAFCHNALPSIYWLLDELLFRERNRS
jgi:hypothetical protein